MGFGYYNKRSYRKSISHTGMIGGRMSSRSEPVAGEPNPFRFKITKYVEMRGHLCAWINYPDCYNYEGNKILVFKNMPNVQTFLQLRKLDPHFLEHGEFTPFARFKPTSEGWNAAIKLMEIL